MYKILGMAIVYGLFFSCAQKEVKNQSSHAKTLCEFKSSDIEKRHIFMSVSSNQKLTSCFLNYLRFETQKKQKISTCNKIHIRKNGKVSFALSMRDKNSKMPKDLRMCIEQELWSMNFEKLQLSSSKKITFPLIFQSI